MAHPGATASGVTVPRRFPQAAAGRCDKKAPTILVLVPGAMQKSEFNNVHRKGPVHMKSVSRTHFWFSSLQIVAALVAVITAVTVQPLRAQNVSATLNIGIQPQAVAVNPVTNKIYVANAGGTAAVIDGATGAV